MTKYLLVIEDFLLVNGLTKSYAPLIGELFREINKNDILVINASVKREIGFNINSTVRSIENMMTKLLEAEVLIRVDRGRYCFCKELQNLSKNSSENIMLSIEYEDKEKIIKINMGGK